jgi:hypothetical protein
MNKKNKPLDYYCFSSNGKITYDPKKGKVFEPWWAILECDNEILRYYKWLLLKEGIEIQKGSLWGAHITWIRGEEPHNKSFWGKYDGIEIEFRYSNFLRYDNGRHVWLDVYCPKFNEMREELGLQPLRSMSLHLTIGRLVIQRENIKHLSTYQYDD